MPTGLEAVERSTRLTEANKMKWYAFKAYNTSTMYGYGTFREARLYQNYLNANREINQYTLITVKDPSTINGIEFNLNDELTELFH